MIEIHELYPYSASPQCRREWLLGGHLETVSPEEMQRRYTVLFDR